MEKGIGHFIEEFNKRARNGLAANPELAVLVPGESSDPSDQPLAGDEHVCGVASVKYLGTPHWLLILRMPKREGKAIQNHARQVQILAGYINDKMQSDDRFQAAHVWPLHMFEQSQAILFQQARIARDMSAYDNWVNVRRVLCIAPPCHDGIFIAALQDTFGKDKALIFSMAFFYARSLWFLVPGCLGLIIMDEIFQDTHQNTRRIIAQHVVVLWAVAVACFGVRQFTPKAVGLPEEVATPEEEGAPEEETPPMPSMRGITRSDATSRPRRPRAVRTLEFVFVALPLVGLLLFCAFAAFLGVTNLILFVIYDWGDCLNPEFNPPNTENICRDPAVKWGFLGMVVEISCDILLVIVFEICFPLCDKLGEYIASLRNYDDEADRKLLARALVTFFECVESLGFRACLAFIFVPQWNNPTMPAAEANSFICFESEALWCRLQTELGVETRRDVFEKLLNGPFCVAPFIRILVKVIIPKVVGWLIRCYERYMDMPYVPGQFVFRFLALIFSYDGGNVGCCRFVCRGWPFTELQVAQAYCPPAELKNELENTPASGASAPQAEGAEAGEGGCEDESAKVKRTEKRMQEATEQFVSKRFEPDAELVELKLSLSGILFFGPSMPLGVLLTLAAIIVEIRTDLIKMLFVRRRALPETYTSMPKDFVHFLIVIAACSVGWHAGLGLCTYNDHLWKWGELGKVVTAGLGVWILACFGLQLILIECSINRKRRAASDGYSGNNGDGVQTPKDELADGAAVEGSPIGRSAL